MAIKNELKSIHYCDFTDEQISNNEDDYWWACVTVCGEVTAEFYSSFDLSPVYIEALSQLYSRNPTLCEEKRFIYERCERKPEVTEELKQEFLEQLKVHKIVVDCDE